MQDQSEPTAQPVEATGAAAPPGAGTLTDTDLREIAYDTGRDLRSVRRVANGEHVRGKAGADIRRAIAARSAARGR